MMHLRWYGEPWPSDENRASVCENDTYRIDPPTGTKCVECGKKITAYDHGIVTAASPRLWETWRLVVTGYVYTVCSYHLSCFLGVVVGGEIKDTEVERRMRGAESRPISTDSLLGVDAYPADEETIEEIHEPGKGWK